MKKCEKTEHRCKWFPEPNSSVFFTQQVIERREEMFTVLNCERKSQEKRHLDHLVNYHQTTAGGQPGSMQRMSRRQTQQFEDFHNVSVELNKLELANNANVVQGTFILPMQVVSELDTGVQR